MPPSAFHKSLDHADHLLRGLIVAKLRFSVSGNEVSGENSKVKCKKSIIVFVLPYFFNKKEKYKIYPFHTGERIWTIHFGTLWQASMT